MTATDTTEAALAEVRRTAEAATVATSARNIAIRAAAAAGANWSQIAGAAGMTAPGVKKIADRAHEVRPPRSGGR